MPVRPLNRGRRLGEDLAAEREAVRADPRVVFVRCAHERLDLARALPAEAAAHPAGVGRKAAARRKLEPPVGIAMAGYGRRAGRSTGVHDDLEHLLDRVALRLCEIRFASAYLFFRMLAIIDDLSTYS